MGGDRRLGAEVWVLFRDEMARHVAALAGKGHDLAAAARSLHAMRGAAAMMGLASLAEALGDLERALRAGDGAAAARARAAVGPLLADAGVAASFEGVALPVFEDDEGGAAPRAPGERTSEELDLAGYFHADARQRLERVAAALGAMRAAPSPREALDAALRELHALKGGAGMAGVGEVARGAHAMEGALAALRARGARPTAGDLAALSAARDRLVLALRGARGGAREVDELVAVLRASGLLRERDLPGARAATEERPSRGPEVIRVPTSAVRGLTEAVGEVGFVRDRLARHAGAADDLARALQTEARGVEDALRRIGPARPWGAPADALAGLAAVQRALAQGAQALEREADGLRDDAALLASLAGGARAALGRMGAVTAAWLFDRVAAVIEAGAAAEDKHVHVAREGDETEVDRAVAEGLLEPLTQLARNAVAHGVERPAARLARGRPARATVWLRAAVTGDALRLVVEDDGAGIDLAAVRARAVARGLLPRDRRGTDDEALEVLFHPGLSTRATADAAAGRGVGLDLVRREVGALGGAVRVATRAGAGARFEIELVPRALVERVVCVAAGGGRAAFALARVARVVRPWEAPPDVAAVDLARVFGAPERTGGGGFVVVLHTARGQVAARVDDVEPPREIAVRPLPPLLAGVAPWGAAAVSGEGVVTLVVDADALLALAARPR